MENDVFADFDFSNPQYQEARAIFYGLDTQSTAQRHDSTPCDQPCQKVRVLIELRVKQMNRTQNSLRHEAV